MSKSLSSAGPEVSALRLAMITVRSTRVQSTEVNPHGLISAKRAGARRRFVYVPRSVVQCTAVRPADFRFFI